MAVDPDVELTGLAARILRDAVQAYDPVTGFTPALTASDVTMTGSLDLAGSFSAATGSLAALTGPFPALTGSFPALTGSFPAITGALTTLTSSFAAVGTDAAEEPS